MKYICLKDYVMDSKEVAFKKGNVYDFNDNYLTDKNEWGGMHGLMKSTIKKHFKPFKEQKDKVVSQVLNKFKQRSKVGIKKYGATLHDNNTDDFYNHLQEELMDAILYLQKLKNEQSNEPSKKQYQ